MSENPLNLLKAAWTAKVSRYSGMLQAARTRFNLLPVLLSTLGGWNPDAHRALCSVATTIAARGRSTFSRARSILFQRHAALPVTNNALYLMSDLLSEFEEGLCSSEARNNSFPIAFRRIKSRTNFLLIVDILT